VGIAAKLEVPKTKRVAGEPEMKERGWAACWFGVGHAGCAMHALHVSVACTRYVLAAHVGNGLVIVQGMVVGCQSAALKRGRWCR
jgi:hypothetical protein